MSATHVSYEAPGWGVGEVWLDGDRLLHHELPRPGVAQRGKGHPLGNRFVRYFAGEPDDFVDVTIELDGATEFELALTEALRRLSVARSSRTASWLRSPGIRTRSAQPERSALGTASRSSFPATGSWRPTGSAPTARSGSSTSGGCSSSKVPLSEDLRHELAGIAPERDCDRLAELSGLVHTAGSLHLHGRGEIGLQLDLASPALPVARSVSSASSA